MNTFYLYDNSKQKLEAVNAHETVNTLNLFYNIIDCRLVETAPIADRIYAVVDEEGLLKNPIDVNEIEEIETKQRMHLVGKIVFVAIDEEGKTVGLSPEEQDYIKNEIKITTLPSSMFKLLRA